MKIKYYIATAIVIISLLFVSISVFALNPIINQFENRLNQETNKEIQHTLDFYINNKISILEQNVESNGHWTGLIDEFQAEDEEWIYENAGGYLVTEDSGITFSYIKDNVNDKLYYTGDNESRDERYVMSLSSLRNNTSFVSQITVVDGGLMVVVASSISDNDYVPYDGIYALGYFISEKELYNTLNNLLLTKNIQSVEFFDSPVSPIETRDMFTYLYNIDKNRNQQNFIQVNYVNLNVKKIIQDGYTNILILILVLILLLGIILIIMSHFLLKKLRQSIDIIEDIEKGNYNKRLITGGYPYEIKQLFDSINKLSDDIYLANYEIESSYIDSMNIMVKTIEVTDMYTKGHSDRVMEYAVALGRKIGYKDIKNLRNGALLHDIGKVAIPDRILNKPGRLDDEEFEYIKKHPEVGYAIAASSRIISESKDIILSHHERIDGTGYPRGLKGDEIPMGAKILAVADVFDALTSHRSYRKAMSFEEASNILREEAGKALDPKLVDEFLTLAQPLLIKNNI